MRLARLLLLPLLGGFVGFSTTCSSFNVGGTYSALAADPAQIVDAGGQQLRLTRLAQELEHPWSLAFLPDGSMLVTERPGRLRRLDAAGGLDPKPVQGLPTVAARGQGGLLDVLPDPDFAANQIIYLSFAAPIQNGAATRVARARLVGDQLVDTKILLTAGPIGTTTRHFGSRLAIDADGKLLVTAGDRGEMARAQDMADMAGKIFRIERDGGIPADNPFLADPKAAPAIMAYGVRNAQGMAINPWTGAAWYHEHGARGGDEVNILVPGANYGWPLVTHGVDYSGLPIGSGKTRPGVTDPVHVWVPSIAPSGMAFYDSEAIPGWRGSLLVGALAGNMLVRLELDGDKVTKEHRLLEGRLGRIRDVRTGPDGAVYLLTDSSDGALWRLSAEGG